MKKKTPIHNFSTLKRVPNPFKIGLKARGEDIMEKSTHMLISRNLGLVMHPTLLKAKRICTRHYSSKKSIFPPDPKYIRVEDLVDYSLKQLAADVDLVYQYLNKDRGFTLSLGILHNVKKQIVSDEYYLSPLEAHNVNCKSSLRYLLIDTLMDYDDVKV